MKDPTLIEEENLPPIPTDDTDLKRQTFTADWRGWARIGENLPRSMDRAETHFCVASI